MSALIQPNEVHLWQADLAAPENSDLPCLTVLDPSEQARAERFRFAADRRRFILQHTYLRSILARYLDIAPADVDIRTTDRGKPYLAGSSSQDGITFNLSHSGDAIAIAVGRDRPVGVDIEQPDRAVDALVIARQFFSRRESDWLAALPVAARRTAFLRLWTAREALLKATGHGLTVPLSKLAFPAQWEGALRVSHAMANCDAPVDWSILHRSTSPGTLLAVAARGTDWTLVRQTRC